MHKGHGLHGLGVGEAQHAGLLASRRGRLCHPQGHDRGPESGEGQGGQVGRCFPPSCSWTWWLAGCWPGLPSGPPGCCCAASGWVRRSGSACPAPGSWTSRSRRIPQPRRTQTGLGAALAAGLPPLSWGHEPTVLQPRLLELLLQCCGIHEMASTGRIMVPAGIEAVHWHPGALGAGHTGSAMAVIQARPVRPDRGRVFDGQVMTPSGTVLVTVTGYQVTDLGHVADPATTARLTRCLAAHPARPELSNRNSHPEGALR